MLCLFTGLNMIFYYFHIQLVFSYCTKTSKSDKESREKERKKKQREPYNNCLVNIPWGELLQDVLGFGYLNTNKNSQLNSLRAEIFEVDEFEVVSLNLWLSSMNS